jgi:hypothetical protein
MIMLFFTNLDALHDKSMLPVVTGLKIMEISRTCLVSFF